MPKYAIKLGERLLETGILTPEIFDEALVRQAKVGGRIGTQLLDMGVISPYSLTNILNRHHGYPLLMVADDIHVKTNAVAAFPRQFAKAAGFIPISNTRQYFVMGAMDPLGERVVKEVELMMRKPVRVTLLPESLYYQLQRDHMQVATDFFDRHFDPSTVEERPFQEGHQQSVPRNLIVFEVAGIGLAYVRRNKASDATRLGDMLVEDRIVSQSELEGAIARRPGMHLGEVVVEENLVDVRMLSRYLSRHYQCATIDPYVPFKVEPAILKLLHPGPARKCLMLPLAIYENNLLLLTAEPDNEAQLAVAERETGYKIKPVVSPRACLNWQVENSYPPSKKKPS